jgi:glutathione synthase/RimK-type ligase-like ATP-grasp enzyme
MINASKRFEIELLQQCNRHGVNYLKLPTGWYLTKGDNTVIVEQTKSSLDSAEGIAICRSKLKTEEFLVGLGIPTVRSVELTTEAMATGLITPSDKTTVIKPDLGTNSVGVYIVPPKDYVSLVKAFMGARGTGLGPVLQQEFITGKCYRVQVLKREIMFVVEKEITPGEPASISRGAVRSEVLQPVAPAVAQACREIAKHLDMHCIGIDVLSPDITTDLGAVLELNESPTLLPHRAEAFLLSLFS